MSRLFDDYLARRPEALRFYAGDWSDASVRKAVAEATRAYAGPRAAVAGVLSERNHDWLTGDARRRLEVVERGEGLAVVAGQQAGLFTGPLYAIHKAVTVIRLADRLEEELGCPVLPVFWAATNDHDMAEAAQVTLVDRAHALQTFRMEQGGDNASGPRPPVGRVQLGSDARRLLGWAEEHLQSTEFLPELLEELRRAYTAEATIGSAFVELMGRWLGPHGLVLLDPLWPELREPSLQLYERVLAQPDLAGRVLSETGAALKEADYHRQLSMPPNRLPLFATGSDGLRRPLIPGPGGAEVEGAGSVETGELLDPDGPWLLDPNAALRPVLQDHLLPTVVFVGGPSEMAYFAQIGPLYEALGVPRPVALPRARAVIVPRAASRVLEKYGLELEDLAAGPEAAARQVARGLFPEDLEASFAGTAEEIAARLISLKEQVVAFDPTLGKPFDGFTGRMEGDLRKLREKAISNQSRQMETVHAQIQKAAVWLYPDGSPQERRLNLLPFAARHSSAAMLNILLDRLDPDRPAEVQLLTLAEE